VGTVLVPFQSVSQMASQTELGMSCHSNDLPFATHVATLPTTGPCEDHTLLHAIIASYGFNLRMT